MSPHQAAMDVVDGRSSSRSGAIDEGQDELRRTFDIFDTNRDGRISKQEFVEIAGKLHKHFSEEELVSMLSSADENGDGLVDFDEFISLYNEHLNGNNKATRQEEDLNDELKEAFAVFDQDKDGFITPLELHSVLNSLGLHKGKSMVDVKNMIRSVDSDGDGRVNFNEFKVMMSKTLGM